MMRVAVRLAAIGGAVIAICSLFLHWYKNDSVVAGEPGGIPADSGWVSLNGPDILLAGLAGAAILLAVWSLFTRERAVIAAVGLLGLAAVALTIIEIASPPESANRLTELENELNQVGLGSAVESSVTADVGAYLGLAGSVALAVAGIAGALLPDRKRCPDCAKGVPSDAQVCHHCGYRFAGGTEERR